MKKIIIGLFTLVTVCFGFYALSVTPSITPAATTVAPLSWGYITGTAGDEIWNEKIQFYRNGILYHSFYTGAESDTFYLYKQNQYRWSGSKGREMSTAPVPDAITLEWVSYADKQRYKIHLPLPKDLSEQMKKEYPCDPHLVDRKERRLSLGLGMAPGGYTEVFIFAFCIRKLFLVTYGYAKPYVSDYDTRVPLAQQFKNRWKAFKRDNPNIYQDYPLPNPKDWPKLLHPDLEHPEQYAAEVLATPIVQYPQARGCDPCGRTTQ